MAKAVKNNVLRYLERCGVEHTPYSYDTADGNIDAVMDGEIDGFINAFLKKQSLESLAQQD